MLLWLTLSSETFYMLLVLAISLKFLFTLYVRDGFSSYFIEMLWSPTSGILFFNSHLLKTIDSSLVFDTVLRR